MAIAETEKQLLASIKAQSAKLNLLRRARESRGVIERWEVEAHEGLARFVEMCYTVKNTTLVLRPTKSELGALKCNARAGSKTVELRDLIRYATAARLWVNSQGLDLCEPTEVLKHDPYCCRTEGKFEVKLSKEVINLIRERVSGDRFNNLWVGRAVDWACGHSYNLSKMIADTVGVGRSGNAVADARNNLTKMLTNAIAAKKEVAE